MIMKSFMLFALALSPFAQAAPSSSGASMIQTGVSYDISMELTSARPRVLVGVQAFGDYRESETHRTRFFWVSFNGEPGNAASDGSSVNGLSKIDFEVVVAQEIEEDLSNGDPHDYFTYGVRFSPIEYRRDVLLGVNHGFTAFALGYALEGESAASSRLGRKSALVAQFVKLAVDVLGMQYMDITTPGGVRGDFGGIKLFRLKGEGGYSLNFSERTSLRLVYAGLRTDLSVGSGTASSEDNVWLLSTEFFSRIELAIDRGYRTLYVEGGSRGSSLGKSEYTQNYRYVTIGFSGVY